MRTRTKLVSASLGFVTATTVLAVWQATPPRLENAGQRLPIRSVLGWLSPEELLCREGIFNLRTQKLQPLPIVPTDYLSDASTLYDDPIPSPDGKWLLYGETRAHRMQRERCFVAIHPDGTGLQRISIPRYEWGGEARWLSNSKGWINYWANINMSGSSQYTLNKSYPEGLGASCFTTPDAIQSDGQFLYINEFNQEFSLCTKDDQLSCRTTNIFSRELTDRVERINVSRDSKTVLASRCVTDRVVPERETWEVLLKRKLPIAYHELWVLSGSGRPRRCLVRETVTDERATSLDGFVMKLSPDGKQAVVAYQQDATSFYLLSL